MKPGLVFDIGMHNGDDTAYYLHLGYSVVGVDANPLLAAAGATRFQKEIREGRMKVINVGILRQPGEFTFYRNLHDDGWSSFDPERGKNGGKWEAVTVPCITADQLVREHGKPHFMKIDIEGADLEAVESLTPTTAPGYISVELSLEDPIVEALIELGYSSFKFVDGDQYRPNPIICGHQVGWRLVRKVGRTFPVVRSTISKLPERFRPKSEFNPPGKYSPDGYRFTDYNSGPFGEQAAGRWLNRERATRWFRQLRDDYTKGKEPFWWDVHARHSSVG